MATPAAAAPVVAGEPKAAGTNDLGQPITAGWRDSLPEDMRGLETLKKFDGKDWSEVGPKAVISYVNLEKMPRGVTVPKEDAKPEEWAAFYEKLGRPKTPNDYAIDVKVPEGMPWNKTAEANMLKHLHDAGLTKSQATRVLNGYLEEAARGDMFMKQEQARTRDGAEAEMKREWGGLADMKIALVQRGVHEFGDDIGFKAWLDETGAGNDPRFFKFMDRILSPMMEANMIKGENLGVKRSEASSEITKIMASEEYAGKKGREAQQAAVARISELYPIAHAE